VYGAYGEAAASVTQDFAEFNLDGGGFLRRVPSTFAFVAQYFAFTAAMVAVTYAWWRSSSERKGSGLRCAVWLLLLLAGFLSGARAAFLFLPFLMVMILVLEGRTARFAVARLVAPALLLVGVAVAVVGATAGGVLGHVVEVGVEEFDSVFVDGLRQGLATTTVGLGTGVDTNAARYAFGQTDRFVGVGGTWYESWYVKALLELGVAGLALLLALLGVLVATAVRNHRRLRDPRLKVVSASLIGLLLWNLVFNTKAQYLDIDPMNVYFWLFLGLLLKLPELDIADDAG
jgi:O-antigen ligase